MTFVPVRELAPGDAKIPRALMLSARDPVLGSFWTSPSWTGSMGFEVFLDHGTPAGGRRQPATTTGRFKSAVASAPRRR